MYLGSLKSPECLFSNAPKIIKNEILTRKLWCQTYSKPKCSTRIRSDFFVIGLGIPGAWQWSDGAVVTVCLWTLPHQQRCPHGLEWFSGVFLKVCNGFQRVSEWFSGSWRRIVVVFDKIGQRLVDIRSVAPTAGPRTNSGSALRESWFVMPADLPPVYDYRCDKNLVYPGYWENPYDFFHFYPVGSGYRQSRRSPGDSAGAVRSFCQIQMNPTLEKRETVISTCESE